MSPPLPGRPPAGTLHLLHERRRPDPTLFQDFLAAVTGKLRRQNFRPIWLAACAAAPALIYQHATRERDKAIADALGKLADTAKAGPA
jgi:hypothetical protein